MNLVMNPAVERADGEQELPGAGHYRFIRLSAGMDEIWSGDLRAFVLAPPAESPLVLTGICPHRGGPLAQGEFDCRSRSLRCPWHGQRHSLVRLRALALPAIRIGDCWLVALDAHESGPESAAEPICFARHRVTMLAVPEGGNDTDGAPPGNIPKHES